MICQLKYFIFNHSGAFLNSADDTSVSKSVTLQKRDSGVASSRRVSFGMLKARDDERSHYPALSSTTTNNEGDGDYEK